MTEELERALVDLRAQVEAAAKNCSTLALALFAACLFSLFTCGTFTDAQLITNSAVTASIRGIGLSLPVHRFVEAAPFLLLSLQVYLLVNLNGLQILGRDLASQPSALNNFVHWRLHFSIFTALVPGSSITYQAQWGVVTWRQGNLLRAAVANFQAAHVGLAELSTKPLNWTGLVWETASGINMRGKNLRYLFGFRMFAVNSQFNQSHLTGAFLAGADLRGATFDDTLLDQVDLSDCLGAGGGCVLFVPDEAVAVIRG